MTETVGASPTSGARSRNGKPATGLVLERLYTTEGVHPYDEVTWERRDVVMTNWRDGSVNFEQRGVEFPDFWSVNATNIVTSKYFRGAVGTDARESSLRQIIDRVVNTYTAAGRANGYFARDADVEIFSHELTWMLLHQVFAFNSPVWFNVGTASPQQVSACQPYDALVSTTAGLVPIGQLVAQDALGTKVYDAHGVTRIQAQWDQGSAEDPDKGRSGPGRHCGPLGLAQHRGGNRAIRSGRRASSWRHPGVAPSSRVRRGRDHDTRGGRGGPGRLAAGRRIRRPVHGHQPLVDHRGDDGDRCRTRVGDRSTR
jgi:hypothetical protein